MELKNFDEDLAVGKVSQLLLALNLDGEIKPGSGKVFEKTIDEFLVPLKKHILNEQSVEKKKCECKKENVNEENVSKINKVNVNGDKIKTKHMCPKLGISEIIENLSIHHQIISDKKIPKDAKQDDVILSEKPKKTGKSDSFSPHEVVSCKKSSIEKKKIKIHLGEEWNGMLKSLANLHVSKEPKQHQIKNGECQNENLPSDTSGLRARGVSKQGKVLNKNRNQKLERLSECISTVRDSKSNDNRLHNPCSESPSIPINSDSCDLLNLSGCDSPDSGYGSPQLHAPTQVETDLHDFSEILNSNNFDDTFLECIGDVDSSFLDSLLDDDVVFDVANAVGSVEDSFKEIKSSQNNATTVVNNTTLLRPDNGTLSCIPAIVPSTSDNITLSQQVNLEHFESSVNLHQSSNSNFCNLPMYHQLSVDFPQTIRHSLPNTKNSSLGNGVIPCSDMSKAAPHQNNKCGKLENCVTCQRSNNKIRVPKNIETVSRESNSQSVKPCSQNNILNASFSSANGVITGTFQSPVVVVVVTQNLPEKDRTVASKYYKSTKMQKKIIPSKPRKIKPRQPNMSINPAKEALFMTLNKEKTEKYMRAIYSSARRSDKNLDQRNEDSSIIHIVDVCNNQSNLHKAVFQRDMELIFCLVEIQRQYDLENLSRAINILDQFGKSARDYVAGDSSDICRIVDGYLGHYCQN